jgi:cytochrome c-type biogenesis protein CcmH
MKTWILLLFMFAQTVSAEIEVYDFKDPVLEKRYQSLTEELRCLVCQNQNIADSHAELAQDLRRKVFELLNRGQSDTEIVDYMTDRYGDFVLYRPPFNFKTMILWLGPLLAVLLGALGYSRVVKNTKRSPDTASEDDLKAVQNLLDKE